MQSLPFIFASAFVIGLTGAMMPGPVLVATINRSARIGFRAGPLVVLGHAIIEAALVIAVILGLGAALQKPLLIKPIMLVGGSVLIVLGANILNEVRTGKAALPGGPDPSSRQVQESLLRPVVEGIVLSASNPYWTLWWATIGLTYIAIASQSGPLGIPAFYSGHILSDLAWYSAVAAGVVVGTRRVTGLGYRLILAGCSIFLIALGFLFAWRGTSGLAAML